MYGGREAVQLGMADRIETLDAVVDRLLVDGRGQAKGRRSASAELRKRRLRLYESL